MQNNWLGKVFRSLPGFKGKFRMGRYFFHDRIVNGRDLVVRGKWDCIYKLPNLSECLALDIFLNGIYEKDTHAFLMKRIPPGGTFLDLGGNIGTISIPLCARRKDISCIAVEAAPWIFRYLQFNIEANHLGERVFCVNRALSDQDGGQVPFYSPFDQFGKGSLSPVFTNNSVMIDRITIDTLLQELDVHTVTMIKIDIEGYEYFAFKGAARLLQSEQAPEIIFEFVDWAEDMAGLSKGSAQDILKEYGYHIYDLNNGKLSLLNRTLNEGNHLLFASKNKSSII